MLQYPTSYNFVRIAAASPEVFPGDIDSNIKAIADSLRTLSKKNVDLAVFPELSVTGYTCADLFNQSILLDNTEKALASLFEYADVRDIIFAVGAPLRYGNALYNCAVIYGDTGILGVVPKSYIPNYNEFYEKRWFHSGINIKGEKITIGGYEYPFGTDLIFDAGGVRFGVEICEDLWMPEPPSGQLSAMGADIILNLSASDDAIGKRKYLSSLILHQSARCRGIYAYASAGRGESSTDLVFSGLCMIAEDGAPLSSNVADEKFEYAIADADVEKIRNDRMRYNTFADTPLRFTPSIVNISHIFKKNDDLLRTLKQHPFVDEDPEKNKENCEEILNIQARGLARRLKTLGGCSAVIGISGGLDSTLALLVTVNAFDLLGLDRKGIIGVTMPGFGTTSRTHTNATKLMELLGVTMKEINISAAVTRHFSDIGHNPKVFDATYENSQARERTQILMDLANQTGGIVIGTGDLSELALGWCTYNGDQMSMYGVNASIPKTLVKYLVATYAELSSDMKIRKVLFDIVDTPISPELLPASDNDDILQKTEDLVGPYELHDFFIYHMMRNGFAPSKIYYLCRKAFGDKYTNEETLHWLKTFYRRFFNQQFKRSCMPDGVKVGSICLSPRGDWRMPSDAYSKMWMDDINKISSDN